MKDLPAHYAGLQILWHRGVCGVIGRCLMEEVPHARHH